MGQDNITIYQYASYFSDTFYGRKDLRKFLACNKIISRGVKGSSSDRYSKMSIANIGNYDDLDVVGISVNGKRKNRISLNYKEVEKALKVGCTIITDNKKDRLRDYNVGEREIAQYLCDNGYKEQEDTGTWTPKAKLKWK